MFLILFSFVFLHDESSGDMFVRQPSPTIDATLICSLFPDFTPEQTNLCVKNPQVVAAISRGVNTGLKECEYQFQNQRWNCSSTKDKSSFGQTRAIPGTREASFTSAIVAAGVAHAVTRECAKGNISSCSCDKTNQGKPAQGKWKWGGCSDDINYGITISNQFLDVSRRSLNKAHHLQNKHNGDTGRKVIRESFKTDCRCNGLCGSCSHKTCWKSLTLFREVGNILKAKYKKAVKVVPFTVNSRHGKYPKVLVHSKRRSIKSTDDELVYLSSSPSYCGPIKKNGFAGTSGRECNHLSKGQDGCEHLCCGRGYNKIEFVKKIDCNCQFIWCCVVDCDICRVPTQVTLCK